MRLHALTFALLCALSAPVLADEAAKPAPAAPAAPKVKWVLPWKPGLALAYATEDTTTEEKDGTTTRTRGTDTTRVRVAAGADGGFVQTWTGEGGKYDLLEGPPSAQAMLKETRAAAAAFEGTPIEVRLAADGTYAGVRNIEPLVAKMRELMQPVIVAGVEAELAKIEDPKKREQARAAAQQRVQPTMDRLLTPAYVEALLTRQIQDYDGFHGLELEPDQSYEAETQLPNPLGGTAFPAKITFSMSVSEDDPEDLYVAWDMVIDPDKAAQAALEIGEKMAGRKLDKTGKEALAKLDIADEGIIVVYRPTGVVEMFESTRTTQVPGQSKKIERHRMRLLDGAHDHTWRDAQETAGAEAAKDEQG
jgi:hypothetical protein